MILFLSFLSINSKVNNIGVTQLSINSPSTIEITLDQPNTSSYIFFSNYPPNHTYISRKNSEKLYLENRNMFISDTSTSLHIESPIDNTIILTIWIIPSEICENSARIFKTNQFIFSHWVFTNELKKMCYFPVNNVAAKADITLLSPSKLPIKSHITVYSSDTKNSLYVYQNLTQSQKFKPHDKPFFISLRNAGYGTIFAYDIHFSNIIEDVCIDEPFQYLDPLESRFVSTFSSIDSPSFACSNSNDNFIIKMILIGFLLLGLIVIGVIAYCMFKK